jgi:hypothetical protein
MPTMATAIMISMSVNPRSASWLQRIINETPRS